MGKKSVAKKKLQNCSMSTCCRSATFRRKGLIDCCTSTVYKQMNKQKNKQNKTKQNSRLDSRIGTCSPTPVWPTPISTKMWHFTYFGMKGSESGLTKRNHIMGSTRYISYLQVLDIPCGRCRFCVGVATWVHILYR